MTIEAVQTRQQGLPLILAEIISSARRRAGVSALSDDLLRIEIRDWMKLCEAIPPERIEECAIRAVRTRTVKALLQPQELIAAWNELRSEENARRPISLDPPQARCYYCRDTGWQPVIERDERGVMMESLRACVCQKAPQPYRSEFPLREPHWQRDEMDRWSKANNA